MATVTGSQTINSINNDTISEAETTVDFKYPSESDSVMNLHLVEKQQNQPETILCDDNNQQQQREQQITEVKEQHIIDFYASEHTYSNIIVDNDDEEEKIHHPHEQQQREQQQQLLSKQYQQKQCKHKKLQHNKTQRDNCCLSVIYKRDSGLMVGVSGDCSGGQQKEQRQQKPQQKQSIIGDNHDDGDDAKSGYNVEHMKQNIGFVIENHTIGDFNDNEDLLEYRTKEKVASTFVDDLTR